MSVKLYEEDPPADEAADIERLIELTIRAMRAKYLVGTQTRDTHAKGLAAVTGTFTIAPDLPADLRVGLFATPRSYKCVCRFSNTDPNPAPDRHPDMRALSIKLLDVDGEMLWTEEPEARTLDLLLMTARTFMTSDLKTFITMQETLLKADTQKGSFGLFAFFAKNFKVARRVLNGEVPCANLLEVPYYSETPYRFGEKAVQYRMVPRKKPTSRLPRKGAAFNFLNERLREDLGAGEAVFDFMVQFQVDPVKMPIEDSGVVWSDVLSPPRKVATFTLHQQVVQPASTQTTGEHWSFNPWRTLPEHKPLGWTNRVRRAVYPAISKYRHQQNGQPVREPREFPDPVPDLVKEVKS